MSTHVLVLHEVENDHWPAQIARAVCLRARRRQMRTVDVRPETRFWPEKSVAAMSWAAYRLAPRF